MKSTPNFLAAAAVAVALVAITTTVPAADGSGADRQAQRIERHLDRMTERLGLDDAQRSQLQTVLQEQSDKRRALREETSARINGVLTAEQQAQFEQMREQRREMKRERRQQRRDQAAATQ